MVPDRPRTRRFAIRSKKGCPTCRIRHVKCDEVHPTCGPCFATDRVCDSVPPAKAIGLHIVQWQSTDTGSARVYARQPNELPLVLYARPLTSDCGPRVNVSREYYRLVASKALFTPFGDSFWSTLVLQIATAETAVDHACQAVGRLYRSIEESQQHTEDGKEALQSYCAALCQLRPLLSSTDPQKFAVAATVSLLCVCFEILAGRYPAALLHLNGGLHILQQADRSGRGFGFGTNVSAIELELRRAFLRLDVQASAYMASRAPLIHVEPRKPMYSGESSLDEAERSLHALLYRVRLFIRGIADKYRYMTVGGVSLPLIAERSSLLEQLRNWWTRFDTLLSITHISVPSHRISLQRLCRTLRVQYASAVIELAACLEAEESIYDAFDDDFRLLVSVAKDHVSTQSAFGNADNTTYTFDMGFTYPLYWAALKCRDSTLRREALHLLSNMHVQEGVWCSRELAAIAESVILLEEGDREWIAHSPRVPEHLRTHGVSLEGSGPRSVVEVNCTRRPNGPDGEWDRVTLMVAVPSAVAKVEAAQAT